MQEAAFVINVKTNKGTIITLRNDDKEVLTSHLEALSLDERFIGSVKALEETLGLRSTAPAAQTPMSVDQVAKAFNATPIATHTVASVVTPDGSAPTRHCLHGKMTAIQGPAKNGGIYKGFFCPAPQGASDKCKTQYVNPKDADFASFAPDLQK
jgi:hypothetical protein